MDRKKFFWIAGIGCGLLLLLVVVAIPAAFFLAIPDTGSGGQVIADEPATAATVPAGAGSTQEAIPTLTPAPQSADFPPSEPAAQVIDSQLLTELYNKLTPGVVSIRVNVEQAGRSGQSAGSGFILDDQGHIVTNNHVVAQAQTTTVIFSDGTEIRAEVIGTDADSDLAVLEVEEYPEGTHLLPIGNSEEVEPGDWVVAIGNPFGLNSSMTVGIVSAEGRTIPSGAQNFTIPQAIQTDAAINPGNSGGPLLNLEGQVIGVNAQIATGGAQANAGVGFAIPANTVRRVTPVLIENGSFEWPWLGITGDGVDLLYQEANDLDTQQGAVVVEVIEGSPADQAGLQGATDIQEVNGLPVPVGGDVIVAADGEPVEDFSDLLIGISERSPGDELSLTVLRDGERQQVTVTLEARPETVGQP